MSVRIGIIGTGGFMRWHIKNLLEVPEASIVALVDPDPAQIQRTKKECPTLAEVAAFSDYREMLEGSVLDAVEIATPHTQHLQQVKDSFARGCHVLIEKPLATTIADSEEMIRARDASGKVGYLSYQRHTSAAYTWVKAAIESGRYGKVQMVSALLCQEWKKFTIGSWRQDPALSGGGMFLDSGSHMLDAILWMTGLQPVTISGQLDYRDTPVEINAAVSFRAANGILGTITICGDAPNWHEEIIVWCDGGAFFIRNGTLTVHEANGSQFEGVDLKGGCSPDRAFVDTILGKMPNPTAFEDGLKVMKLTQAAYDSARQGGAPITL